MKSTLTKRGVHFKSSGYRVKNLPFAVNTFLLDFLFVDIMYCACIIYLEDVFGFGKALYATFDIRKLSSTDRYFCSK